MGIMSKRPNEYQIPFSWKLWSLLFRDFHSTELYWRRFVLHEDDTISLVDDLHEYLAKQREESPDEESWVMSENILHSGLYLESGRKHVVDAARLQADCSWNEVELLSGGMIKYKGCDEPFYCDIGYIEFLCNEVERILKHAETPSAIQAEGVKEDFRRALDILRWRLDVTSDLENLQYEYIGALFDILDYNCLEQHHIARYYSDDEKYLTTVGKLIRTYHVYDDIWQKEVDELEVLNRHDFIKAFWRDDNYHQIMDISFSPRSGYGISTFVLLMVSYSFDATDSDIPDTRLSVKSLFNLGNCLRKSQNDGIALVPTCISINKNYISEYEKMTGRGTFLDLDNAIAKKYGTALNAEWHFGKHWTPFFYWPASEHDWGKTEVQFWNKFIEPCSSDNPDNILIHDYESYIDEIARADYHETVLLSLLSIIDAENRFLMQNRNEILRHPIGCLYEKKIRQALKDADEFPASVNEIYRDDSVKPKKVADWLEAYAKVLANEALSRRLLLREDPVVKETLDAIVMVNLRVASYIRDKMLMAQYEGAVTSPMVSSRVIENQKECTLRSIRDRCTLECDMNGSFGHVKKVDIAKTLFKDEIIVPKQAPPKYGTNWSYFIWQIMGEYYPLYENLSLVLPYPEEGSIDSFESVLKDTRKHEAIVSEFLKVFKEANFDTSTLVVEGTPTFSYRVKSARTNHADGSMEESIVPGATCNTDSEVAVTFSILKRAILDMCTHKHSDRWEPRTQWILKLLRQYRENHIKGK